MSHSTTEKQAQNDGRQKEPVKLTASQLLAMQFPEPTWAVDDLIVEGLTVLGGKPKVGKSWLMLAVALAIAQGGAALGGVPVEQGDVLYLALEDNWRRLKARLERLLPDGPPLPTDHDASRPLTLERLHLVTSARTLQPSVASWIDRWLSEHPDARLVGIDTLAKVRGTRLKGEDLYAADYKLGERLKAMADQHRVAFLVAHHLRKAEADDFVDAVSGTLGLTGAADSVLVLKRERGRHDAALHVTGRDIEDEREVALKWDPLVGWGVLDGVAQDYRRSPEREDVLKAVSSATGPITPKEVAEKLGKGRPAVRKLMADMAKDGELRSWGGRYTLPTAPDAEVGNSGDRGNGVTGVTGVTGPRRGDEAVTHAATGNSLGNSPNGALPDRDAGAVTAVTRVTSPPESEVTGHAEAGDAFAGLLEAEPPPVEEDTANAGADVVEKEMV